MVLGGNCMQFLSKHLDFCLFRRGGKYPPFMFHQLFGKIFSVKNPGPVGSGTPGISVTNIFEPTSNYDYTGSLSRPLSGHAITGDSVPR